MHCLVAFADARLEPSRSESMLVEGSCGTILHRVLMRNIHAQCASMFQEPTDVAIKMSSQEAGTKFHSGGLFTKRIAETS